MSGKAVITVLLIALMGAALSQGGTSVAWTAFLYGVPLGLIGCLLANQRWALMGVVIYGTVGLALDIATIVQGFTRPDGARTALAVSGATGVVNFLLIVFGGKGFLDVSGASSPPESPRPNPRSPSSI